VQAFEMIKFHIRGLVRLPTIATRQTGQAFIGAWAAEMVIFFLLLQILDYSAAQRHCG
jgi:hypothetical protein